MGRTMRRWASLALAASLVLGTTALAVEPAKTQAEQRQEDVTALYETLAERHPNLFANRPESDFLARKGEIEQRLDTVSDADFVLDLQSLVALAGDSHTGVSFGAAMQEARFYPMDFSWMDGKWYFSASEKEYEPLLGAEVTAVNGVSMPEVLEAFQCGQFGEAAAAV